MRFFPLILDAAAANFLWASSTSRPSPSRRRMAAVFAKHSAVVTMVKMVPGTVTTPLDTAVDHALNVFQMSSLVSPKLGFEPR